MARNEDSKAKLPSIGKDDDDAMVAIEKENPILKSVLHKVMLKLPMFLRDCV